MRIFFLSIENDIDICLHLLFNPDTRIALSPLSPFGMNPKLGLMRITCSNYDTLIEIFKRLEVELIKARQNKQKILKKRISYAIQSLREIDSEKADSISRKIESIFLSELDGVAPVLKLKKQNMVFQSILNEIEDHLPNKRREKEQNLKASMSIANASRGFKEIGEIFEAEWKKH